MLCFQSLSNVAENKPPPGSPLEPLWRELPISRAFFNISLKFLIKVLLIKKFYPSLKGHRKGSPLPPPPLPQIGALMEQDINFQSLT